MPSRTPKQARAMAAAAHNPAVSRKLGIPRHVAQEFNRADANSGYLAKAMRAMEPMRAPTAAPRKRAGR